MRIALVFLAGMAFVAGVNKYAHSLEEQSLQVTPPATAEEYAAFKERWRANRLAANDSPSLGEHVIATAHR